MTVKASTVNRDWTIRTTTFALPYSAAPRWAWPATCFAPTSFIATTGRPGWCRPTCAPRFATDPTFLGCRTLFTIHNLGYQGLFPKTALAEVALDPSVYRPDGMEFFGRVSYIKAGIEFADALSTVSPTYAREIQTPEFGFGLDARLRERANVLTGILNGVDYAEWSPQTDAHIPAHYSTEDLGGKAICKRKLLEEFGLPAEAMDRPLLGVVSRFTRQKGTDILAEIAAQIVAEDVYLVALGTGDPEYEEFFVRMQAEHPGRIAVRIGFDERAGAPHRGRGGHVPDAQPLRALRAEPDLQPALRHGTGGPRHRRAG